MPNVFDINLQLVVGSRERVRDIHQVFGGIFAKSIY